jgi:hypothetical protein
MRLRTYGLRMYANSHGCRQICCLWCRRPSHQAAGRSKSQTPGTKCLQTSGSQTKPGSSPASPDLWLDRLLYKQPKLLATHSRERDVRVHAPNFLAAGVLCAHTAQWRLPAMPQDSRPWHFYIQYMRICTHATSPITCTAAGGGAAAALTTFDPDLQSHAVPQTHSSHQQPYHQRRPAAYQAGHSNAASCGTSITAHSVYCAGHAGQRARRGVISNSGGDTEPNKCRCSVPKVGKEVQA